MFIKDLCKSVKGHAGLYEGGYRQPTLRYSIIHQTSRATLEQAYRLDSTDISRWLAVMVTTLEEEPF